MNKGTPENSSRKYSESSKTQETTSKGTDHTG